MNRQKKVEAINTIADQYDAVARAQRKLIDVLSKMDGKVINKGILKKLNGITVAGNPIVYGIADHPSGHIRLYTYILSDNVPTRCYTLCIMDRTCFNDKKRLNAAKVIENIRIMIDQNCKKAAEGRLSAKTILYDLAEFEDTVAKARKIRESISSIAAEVFYDELRARFE